jgi:hypothetical protein
MTGRLPRIRRGITTATEAPTRLNRVELAVPEAPILITEQEVLLSTAAAVTVPSKKITEQWIALLRPGRPRSTADERATKHKHYPHHHHVFLEQALMAREMERC